MAASDSEARPLAGLRVVDLADEKGELCGRLTSAPTCCSNPSRPPSARLAIDPGDVLARHPHLVFASLSDFGSPGPYRDWVATDDVLDAMGGMVFKAGIRALVRRDLSPARALAGEPAARFSPTSLPRLSFGPRHQRLACHLRRPRATPRPQRRRPTPSSWRGSPG